MYDGRDFLGNVVDRGVDAATADGSDLGRFPNIAAAMTAVVQAARAGR